MISPFGLYKSATRRFATVIAFLAISVAPAAAVPCSGGDLDFNATSNLPVLPGSTFNVGQQVDLAAITTGFSATTFSWTVDGPLVKDYEERLGTTTSGALSWGTTALSPVDFAVPEIRFYWKPSPSQIHPLNGGPVTRNVTLTVTMSTASCAVTKSYLVERNETDVDRQPNDFYTSNHRALMETNIFKGIVIDDHMQWHVNNTSRLYGFLPWHSRFIARYQQWRTEFGYAPVEPWNPGTPLPTDVAHQHTPRFPAYDPESNLLPTYNTIAGGTETNGFGHTRLADFTSPAQFSDDFEFDFHGVPHCNIGPGGFGGMCDYSSPKDPMFWRWHLFIDLLYRNYCALKSITCDSGPDLVTDIWMADNTDDLAAAGTEPSPPEHWLSVDIWNRSTDAACTPTIPVPGAARDCGSSADHENPVAGAGNFLYATLRNDRPGAQKLVYAEVAVYIANAATGLAWPADFNGGVPLPETRRFLTLSLSPGQSVDIGPPPWKAPNPRPSDHFCLYVRILTAQDSLIAEGINIDQNVAADNSISWRNLNIVPSGAALVSGFTTRFIVRNWREDEARIDLAIEAAKDLLQAGEIRLQLDGGLLNAWKKSDGFAKGLELKGKAFLVRDRHAQLGGFKLAPRQEGVAAIRVISKGQIEPGSPLLSLRQATDGKEDGGIDLVLSGNPNATKGLPDLAVEVDGPRKVRAGRHLQRPLKLTLANHGSRQATGTVENDHAGYRIALALWEKGEVLLKDDLLRESRGIPIATPQLPTPTLKPGEVIALPLDFVVPRKVLAGSYCLLVSADYENMVVETNESNNEICLDVEVGP